jgi:hypothetical protein
MANSFVLGVETGMGSGPLFRKPGRKKVGKIRWQIS